MQVRNLSDEIDIYLFLMLQVSRHKLDSRDGVQDRWLVVCIWYMVKVDLQEARQFDKGSESWWNSGGETRFGEGKLGEENAKNGQKDGESLVVSGEYWVPQGIWVMSLEYLKYPETWPILVESTVLVCKIQIVC